MTDKPSMVTDVTVINRINIHWKWLQDGNGLRYDKHQRGKEEAAKQKLNKNTRSRVDTQMIGTKKNTFKL